MEFGGESDLDTLSVLFTDLVGSTELRARLGEDAADVVRRAHDALIAEVVEGNGGRVVKGLGDGFLATFGSAARAVAAAVAIQQGLDMQRFVEPRVALSVRIGISLGDVNVESGDVYGTPVIEASRLCAAAEGGQILASAVVATLARGRADQSFTHVGDLELKGLPDPLPTVQIQWTPRARDDDGEIPFPPALVVREGTFPFHGRDEALDQLAVAWKRALHDATAACVLVSGEPGMGKTRLAAEFAARVHDDGATVLFGRCDEDLGIPYQPFVEALAHFVAHVRPADAARLGTRAADLGRLVPELPAHLPEVGVPSPSGDAEVDQYRLFEAVDAWLRAAAGDAGVVLVLDDVHWAAKPTLLMLRHLLRSSTPARLLIVSTYRDTDLDRTHPLGELLADLRRVPEVERLALSGLDRSGIEEIMAAVNQQDLDDAGRQLAAAVHAETEGNPFFVGEVLRHLAESGALVRDGTRWVPSTSVAQMSIPDGVREVVGRRLSRLSDAANDVLSWAAVIGRDLRLDVLSLVAGGDDRCLDALDEAVGARLVDEAGTGRWRFAHALVRATLLAELRTTRKVRMHLAVGEAYEQVAPDDLAALAQHFAEAATFGAGDKAVRYLLEAGTSALDTLAFDQAERLHRQALDVIDDVHLDAPELRADALVGLAIARRWNGAGSDARGVILDACDAAAALGDGERMARVLLDTSRGFVREVFLVDAEIVERLERCLELLPPGDSRERALVTMSLCGELSYSGQVERLVRLSGEAVDVARRVGDPDTLAIALSARLNAFAFPDSLDQTPALYAEVEALGDWAVTAGTEFRCAQASAVHAGWTGDRDRFRNGLERMLAHAEFAPPAGRWQIPSVQAGYELRFGDLAVAEARSEEVLRHATQTGEVDAHLWHLNLLGFTLRQQGRIAEWLELYGPYVGDATGGDDAVSGAAGSLFVVALCEGERHDEARALAPRFFAFGRNHVRDTSMLANLGALAIVAAELNARDETAWLLERLEPFTGWWSAWGPNGAVGPVSTLVGRLRLTLGDRAAGNVDLDDAIAHCRANESRFFLAEALLWQGRAWLDRGGDGRARLQEALDLARAGGYGTIQRRAEATLSRS